MPESDPLQQILDRHGVTRELVACNCQISEDHTDPWTQKFRQTIDRYLQRKFAKLKWF